MTVSDIEKWAQEKRANPCPICALPADELKNLTIGWHKLNFRGRILMVYVQDRGIQGATRHWIEKHFRENHGEDN